ncbi:MAG TPA: glycoside hydrolase family 2 TIM barrel-domain containing protein [Microvirga sp.]|jgi:beta-galactosidase|nr:glycoside hydrolase family 2 TIM barrel-domain containing protein [Microvirga sp.]
MPLNKAVLSFLLVIASAVPVWGAQRSLSHDWAFKLGPVEGGERPETDDRDWRRVTVPHDFSIEDRPNASSPFDEGTPTGSASGYIPGGTAWYRRRLSLNADEAAGVVLLHFEAVYMDADIWVNGLHAGRHNYGYTAFQVDLTGLLKAGDNVVAVRVQHDDPSSRWYAGSGILRPVHLDLLDHVHLSRTGPAIATEIATEAIGEVGVSIPIANRSAQPVSVLLTTQVLDRSGREVDRHVQPVRVPAGATEAVARRIVIRRPHLWSIETPDLYTLVQQVTLGGRVIERRDTKFGVRTVAVDAERGFLLNGKRVLLRGGNIHHDNYMIGGAGAPRADERKIELMKAAGYNAVRNAHNPASKATLDAADRLGMLVINEAFDTWAVPKMPRDYARFFRSDWRADIDSLIATGRNHPSVVMWSIGNEIPEQDRPAGAARARELADHVRRRDPTRPVTAAVNKFGEPVAAFLAALDVSGYNYRPQDYRSDHQLHPGRVMYGSESYPADAFTSWRAVETMPWVIGDFVWTAVDYLGEASIGWTGYNADYTRLGPYPWHLAYCGEIDATGLLRPAAYYRGILWKTGKNPIAAFVRFPEPEGSLPDKNFYPASGRREWVQPDIHPSWTWRGHEGKPLQVVVYSELPEVELFLNGVSLGRRGVGVDTRYQTEFAVPYRAGKLEAVGYRDGKPVAHWVLETAGMPAAVRLTVDRSRISPDGSDLAYVTAELVDADGRTVYAREDDLELNVVVEGNGTLAGVGNGNPYKPESFTSGRRTTFNGRAVAAIRSGRTPGWIVVTARAKGLPTATVRIRAEGPE